MYVLNNMKLVEKDFFSDGNLKRITKYKMGSKQLRKRFQSRLLLSKENLRILVVAIVLFCFVFKSDFFSICSAIV